VMGIDIRVGDAPHAVLGAQSFDHHADVAERSEAAAAVPARVAASSYTPR
jgi:hypothetical protein